MGYECGMETLGTLAGVVVVLAVVAAVIGAVTLFARRVWRS